MMSAVSTRRGKGGNHQEIGQERWTCWTKSVGRWKLDKCWYADVFEVDVVFDVGCDCVNVGG